LSAASPEHRFSPLDPGGYARTPFEPVFQGERLLQQAQETLAAHPARAQALYEAALALGRGPPLTDRGDSELARLEAERPDF
jgi:hypothetical protein